MANKQVLSVVAASILAVTFTFTGCGDDESTPASSSSVSSVSSSAPAVSSSAPAVSSSAPAVSSSAPAVSSVSSSSEAPVSSSSEVSSSSAPAVMTTVTVSDAYIINATVTVGAGALIVTDMPGVYEASAVLTGKIVALNGVNDLNADGLVSNDDVLATTLRAPSGYSNVNPYTTLLVMGMENMNVDFPVATALAANYDVDVVASSTLELDKEVLIAAKTIQLNNGINAAKQRGFLPSPTDPTDPVASSSDASSSEAASSSSDGILPEPSTDPVARLSASEIARINAMTAEEILAEFRASFPAAGTPASSSSDGFLPGPGDSSSDASSSDGSFLPDPSSSSSGGGFLPTPA